MRSDIAAVLRNTPGADVEVFEWRDSSGQITWRTLSDDAKHDDWPDDGGYILRECIFGTWADSWRSYGHLESREGLLQLERHLREHRTRHDAPPGQLKTAIKRVRQEILH